jgi:endonuclease/exonuclease/phosphatase family metal-dependent hydrolase
LVVALTLVVLLPLALVAARRIVSPWRAVSLAGPPAGTVAPPPRALWRIGAYNIAHGRGATDDNFGGGNADVRARRLLNIAAFLQAQNLDFVILNEVDFSSLWSGNVDQASAIADAAGYGHVVRQRNLDVGIGPLGLSFGNALLSRWPIVDAQRLPLPARSTLESVVAGQKHAAIVTVDVGLGRLLRIVPVHLEHRDEPTRLASAARFLALANDGGPPVVAVGDFNSTPPSWPLSEPVAGQTAVQALLDGGFSSALDLVTPSGLTYPSWAPNRRIDWTMASAPLRVVGDAVGGGKLSDHLAVWGTISWP